MSVVASLLTKVILLISSDLASIVQNIRFKRHFGANGGYQMLKQRADLQHCQRHQIEVVKEKQKRSKAAICCEFITTELTVKCFDAFGIEDCVVEGMQSQHMIVCKDTQRTQKM